MFRHALLTLVLPLLWGCGASVTRQSAGPDRPARPTIEPASRQATGARRGHAHNDYLHQRPLAEALELGYGSIEADVFLVGGELLVGHSLGELRPERTLRALYLDPLVTLAATRRDQDRPHPPLILLVDIKAEGPAAYGVLHRLLEEREGTFTGLRDGVATPRAVTVIVSGASPRQEIQAQSTRWAFVDGREGDLRGDPAAAPPVSLVPLVSMPWLDSIRWSGPGELPGPERQRLDTLVRAAHERGYMIRFWGAPVTTAIWDALWDAGVDLIGMDDLATGAAYLESRQGEGARHAIQRGLSSQSPPPPGVTPRRSAP